jgi:general secretion pathway protein D
LLDDTARGTALDPGLRVILLAEPRTNSVLLRSSSQARAEQARALITRLDQPTQRGGNIWVVYLKNAEAARLAQTLRAIIGGETGLPSSFGAAAASSSVSGSNSDNTGMSLAPGRANSAPSNNGTDTGSSPSGVSGIASTGGGMIQADPSTNSLIISAPEPVYRNLREIIEKLDVRRVQVFIESLIVEVSADKAAEFGVQWFSGGTAGSASLVGGQVLGGAGSNLISVAANPATLGNGFSLGIVGKKLNLPGIGDVSSVGLLARALETQGNANILSTPTLLTLDNEEAKIVVGQNVPFITGQFTNTGASSGNATVNPFQTIERKDVGITLRVKPQVSDGGTVKLQVFQEVSSVVDRSLSAGIITNKRSIESNVVVDDGQIIVLGGLIEDRSNNSQDKVPGLGDAPFFGNLFRYDSRKQNKTNLMVFLRPVVIRDTAASANVVLDRYDYMRALSADSKPPANWALPDYAAPIPAPLNEQNTVPGNKPLVMERELRQRSEATTSQPKP